jgi:hypothetical protein
VGTKGASRFAVLGQTKQTTAVVARIDKKEAPEVTTVTIDGQFVCRDRSQPPIPFQTLLTVRKGSSNIEVVQTITLPAASAMVKEWAFNLPLVFRGGRFGTKTMVGNDHKYPDIWHLDQSFEQYWGWLLSDKMRWPLWRFGGLLIDSPTHYSIWKTNAADTSATVTYEGNKPPGWLDASDSNDWGVTAVLGGEAMANGPRAITFNGENGALSVGLHPSQVPPLAVTDAAEAGVGLKAGKPVTAKFSLEFHPLRHPTRSPPELTDEQYAALLHLMKDHWSFSSTNFTMMAGVDMDKNTDALIRKLVLADTPPSAMLRTTPGLIAVAMGKLDPAWKPSGDVEADIKVLFQKVRATPVTAPAAK